MIDEPAGSPHPPGQGRGQTPCPLPRVPSMEDGSPQGLGTVPVARTSPVTPAPPTWRGFSAVDFNPTRPLSVFAVMVACSLVCGSDSENSEWGWPHTLPPPRTTWEAPGAAALCFLEATYQACRSAGGCFMEHTPACSVPDRRGLEQVLPKRAHTQERGEGWSSGTGLTQSRLLSLLWRWH